MKNIHKWILSALILPLALTWITIASAGDDFETVCRGLPDWSRLKSKLKSVVAADANGLNHDMWATVVNRDGVVCAVAFSGTDRGQQWPGSRVISAQKANTANAFSLPAGAGGLVPGLALSTANLYSAVQPGGSLFGLQFSNPVDPSIAYRGNPARNGKLNDPMVHKRIGGVNVFGGGLGLYNASQKLRGALGVSGDTSCRDHIVAWKLRDALKLDHVPAGVSATGDDNMILDTTTDPVTGHAVSSGGFGHPACGFGEEAVIPNLPTDFPIGPNP
jgi:uncharacterized protein GlcG (DUF336 family)